SRKAPGLEQQAADLRVMDAERLMLGVDDGPDAIGTGGRGPVGILEARREHQSSDVVQETCGEGLVGIARAQLRAEHLARDRHHDGVHPEPLQARGRDAVRDGVPDLHAEGEVPDRREAEQHDGTRNGGHPSGLSEEGAVREPQHLAGERLVVLDEVDEVAGAGILPLDEPEDLRQHCRDGGQVLAADHLGAEPLAPPPVERSHRPRIHYSVTHTRPPAFGLIDLAVANLELPGSSWYGETSPWPTASTSRSAAPERSPARRPVPATRASAPPPQAAAPRSPGSAGPSATSRRWGRAARWPDGPPYLPRPSSATTGLPSSAMPLSARTWGPRARPMPRAARASHSPARSTRPSGRRSL